MAISVLEGFDYGGKLPNFSRDLFETLADMVGFSENYLPAVFECNVIETGERYRYNISNSVDPDTGKWRLVTSGGDNTNYYKKAEVDELLDLKANEDEFSPVKETVEKLDNPDKTVEGSVRYLDAKIYEDATKYTDEKVGALNKKKSIACDEKPIYIKAGNPDDKDQIQYVVDGETKTIEADEIWFYYIAENDLNGDNIISANEEGLAQTIFIDGVEFTIMSFGIDMTDYVNKNIDVVSDYTGEESDQSKVPNLAAMKKLEEKINNKIQDELSSEKIGYENDKYPLQTNVKKSLDAIWARLDYIKPEIKSFTMDPATTEYEVGQEVTAINFAWDYNKDITTQSLTDVTLTDETDRSASWSGSLKTSKTFTLSCGDGENSATASKTISFKHKIYYGSAVIPTNYDSAFILGLSKNQFATSYKGKYEITVGAGEYAFVCCPENWNMPNSCKIGGFGTDLINVGKFSFTNASGGVTTYKVARTNQAGLGAIEMLFE